jgi:hypothetical protein
MNAAQIFADISAAIDESKRLRSDLPWRVSIEANGLTSIDKSDGTELFHMFVDGREVRFEHRVTNATQVRVDVLGGPEMLTHSNAYHSLD